MSKNNNQLAKSESQTVDLSGKRPDDMSDLAVQPEAASSIKPGEASYKPHHHAEQVGSSDTCSNVESDAEAQGYMLAADVQAAQRRGFARGLTKGIQEGQETNKQFFQEGLRVAEKAFTFGG